MIFLHQTFEKRSVPPAQLDLLWANGWRHFGTHFFRYSLAEHRGRVCSVLPLRVDLHDFTPSRSQKRALARNRDLTFSIRDTVIDETKHALFYRHRVRFEDSVPDSLYTFLSHKPASVPCRNQELCVYAGERLLAASFLDLGQAATSAVYAIFEPEEHKRSLGIYTMLRAIEYSRELGCRYYYPGYAYREPSVYDYKKNFSGLEYLDWDTGWKNYTKEVDRKHHFDNFWGEIEL